MDLALFALLGVLLGALVGAAIGQRKSRPVAGVILGALAGPIGWLVVGLGPDAGPKCPACGGAVEVGRVKCRHCGSDLSWPA